MSYLRGSSGGPAADLRGSCRSSNTEKPPAVTDLVSVSGEAAALHGAGVEVALVVKLEARQARVQLVEDGWQAAPQSQQLCAGAVEANAHGALQGHASSVTQQGAGRKAGDAEKIKLTKQVRLHKNNTLSHFSGAKV